MDFLKKTKYIKDIDREISFHIWDTAGQEYFNSVTRKYYKGANIALFVFSVTDRDSFLAIKSWKDKVEEECGSEIPMLLLMNKIDIPESEHKVSTEECINLSKGVNMSLFRISVKDNLKIDDVFNEAAKMYMNKGLNKKISILPDIADVSKNNSSNKKTKDIKEIDETNNDNKVPKNVSSTYKKTTTDVAFKIENKNNTSNSFITEKKKKNSKCC